MDKMRKEFEAWVTKHRPGTDVLMDEEFQDEYLYAETQYAWEGWRASRAALCVELPENCKGMALTVDEFHSQLDKAGVSHK